ncbi:mannose-1-phosphate guanylyltransferase [Niastella yeongjuensis]|uniref:mannose-1-phosphate guanylyltransferase n=1 Tax=Niastella yeongjuensis TaxID=354355 RepID=A0A1V9FCL1_9BACT|nr:sugar phosphate nucleotidyltransferase [Niastella yeongjuensis]OQP56031.1 mannose-1-phosphate guanylyltransferase [Niastella yeongjuensis]SEP24680.1 mannose-1-phosphate guanylyltransferase [Niastella yeongjuensis]
MQRSTYVVIMAGGIGSRFWPVSRTDYPKQFLDILGTGETLIQQTFRRFERLAPLENIYVVTSTDYTGIVEKQLPLLPKENILSETDRKNTAPCVAYASFRILQKDSNASIIVAPADHLILDQQEFEAVCNKGLQFIETCDALLTIGIKPSYANTGYGYIQFNKETEKDGVHPVITFTEKPDAQRAAKFVSSGEYLWNSGIFMWKARSIINSIEKYLGDLYQLFKEKENWLGTSFERLMITDIYAVCENVSIDVGVMEKANNVYIIPASFRWSDLGTWNSAWENMGKDVRNNAVAGNGVLVIDTTQCVVHASNEKLVVLQGLHNYIVVDTKDVLLICQKEKEQDIKQYVTEVKKLKGERYLYSVNDNVKPAAAVVERVY